MALNLKSTEGTVKGSIYYANIRDSKGWKIQERMLLAKAG
jgi:hypothetical protein